MIRLGVTAEVYQADLDLSDWIVWASDPTGDGGVLVATFSGPDAELRALEYAALKFAGLLRHEPDQRRCRSYQSPSVGADRSSSHGANLRLVR